MKYIIKLSFSILIILLVTIFQFCRKEEIKKIFKVTTGEISGITTNSAIAKGDVVDVVGGTLQYGHCWSTSQKPTYDNDKTILYTEEIPGIFTSSLTGLFPGTTYYIRAFAYEVNDKNRDGINDGIIVYGNEKNFKTEDQTLATIITGSVNEITPNTAKITSILSNPGSGVDSVLQHGHCWSTSQEPTISNNKTELGIRNSTGEFTSDITGLQKDTKYYVRAYATSEVGTAYGNEINFTTYTRVPAIFTLPISSITGNSAESGGNITDNGGAAITARGVCWSTSPNPTILDNITSDGGGTGNFFSSITGLSRGTTYYIRAYSTSSICTAYGNEINFTTLDLPTLNTTPVSNVTSTSVETGGNITDNGGATVTARGVCWSTTPDPTISDNHTSDGTGSGNFYSTITALSRVTTYYARAYATNSVGTAYGNVISFTTSAILPTVTTSSISDIAYNSAKSGGNITDDGGATITTCGICWSTSQNPNISDNFSTDSSGTGIFSSIITGLSPVTTYYIRAYATNSVGTAYGNEISFTTNATVPTVTTISASSITENSAESGGNITDDGGATVTARGVCWSTSANTTISDNFSTDGSGTGEFSGSITGLSPGTTYYVRAYATNNVGTAFGNEISFTTSAILPTVTTSSVSDITYNSAKSGGNITDDGGATVTARGVCWSISANPTISDNFSTDGSGTGEFLSSITGLSPATTYYVRAYATNSAGTAYGNEISFTTYATIPTVTTSSASDIAETSATIGGNVTDDGGATVTERGVYHSTSANPETIGTKLSIGSGTGSYSTTLTGLTPGTIYYIKAYAINSQGEALGNELSFIANSGSGNETGTVNDYDGNTYNTVKIGDQWWMAENLKVTHYHEGTAISLVEGTSAWGALGYSGKAYCFYDNSSANGDTYGALYTWAAVMNSAASSSNNPSGIQGVCPDGWHLPSDAEWTELTDYLGGTNVAGGKLKETGTTHWISPNTGATNESGFTALPGGFRYSNGTFHHLGVYVFFWSTTKRDSISAWFRFLYYDDSDVYRYHDFKNNGFSVRCTKD